MGERQARGAKGKRPVVRDALTLDGHDDVAGREHPPEVAPVWIASTITPLRSAGSPRSRRNAGDSSSVNLAGDVREARVMTVGEIVEEVTDHRRRNEEGDVLFRPDDLECDADDEPPWTTGPPLFPGLMAASVCPAR